VKPCFAPRNLQPCFASSSPALKTIGEARGVTNNASRQQSPNVIKYFQGKAQYEHGGNFQCNDSKMDYEDQDLPKIKINHLL